MMATCFGVEEIFCIFAGFGFLCLCVYDMGSPFIPEDEEFGDSHQNQCYAMFIYSVP